MITCDRCKAPNAEHTSVSTRCGEAEVDEMCPQDPQWCQRVDLCNRCIQEYSKVVQYFLQSKENLR
jgi:hypothetical protein